MGFVIHRTNRRTQATRAGGRRLADRMRAFLANGWDKWTSPYATSDDLTEYEILHLTDGKGN